MWQIQLWLVLVGGPKDRNLWFWGGKAKGWIHLSEEQMLSLPAHTEWSLLIKIHLFLTEVMLQITFKLSTHNPLYLIAPAWSLGLRFHMWFVLFLAWEQVVYLAVNTVW